jgi:hypothetical protein
MKPPIEWTPKGLLAYHMALSSSKVSRGLCQSAVLSGCSLLRYFLKEVTGQAGFPENTLHKSISKIAIDMN